jgi:hypothetical protein
MGLLSWWESHPRSGRNLTVIAILDVAFLLATLLALPYALNVWQVLANTLPNFYEPVFVQFIALLFGLPSRTGAGGSALLIGSQFLTLLTFHALIALLVGWLLRRKENVMLWRILNYCVLGLLLLCLHIAGAFLSYLW